MAKHVGHYEGIFISSYNERYQESFKGAWDLEQENEIDTPLTKYLNEIFCS